MDEVNIIWAENLEELGHPENQVYSCHNTDGISSKRWRTWHVESHIERLYERCDALLRRLNEQEQLIINLTRKNNMTRPSCRWVSCVNGTGLAVRGTCAWGDPENPNCEEFEDIEEFLKERKADHEKTEAFDIKTEKESIPDKSKLESWKT